MFFSAQVTDDGYGVCYCLNGENTIFMHVSTKKSCADTDPDVFLNTFVSSMEDMFALADQDKGKAKAE